MKKIVILCVWLIAAAPLFTAAAAPAALHATKTVAVDTCIHTFTHRQLVRLKKEIHSRLRQLDVLYNKPFYNKEFIYTIDTRDMALLRTRAFFMDLFEKHPEAHDTNMLLQHLGILSTQAKNRAAKRG